MALFVVIIIVLADGRRREHARSLWQRAAIRLDAGARMLLPFVHRTPPLTAIGINIATPTYWADERAFTNLALAGGWQISEGDRYRDAEASDFTRSGALRADLANHRVAIYLARPLDPVDPWIDCTYQGTAMMSVHGAADLPMFTPGRLRFRWRQRTHSEVYLIADQLDRRRPMTGLDCREIGVPQARRFDPAFVAFVHHFEAVRFMGWQRTNDNVPVTWATRNTPSASAVATGDGVSVEDMVALATEAGSDPWFSMPWGGSENYIVGFATYVRDHLPRDRKIYVEVGNEIWNTGFSAGRQASAEGMVAGLAGDLRTAGLRRYAQRTVEVMRLWERVFARESGRLVRVVATQQVNPGTARTVFAWPGLADHVDALATANYFDLGGVPISEELPSLFAQLDRSMASAIENARANKAVASYYGKRYIAYEAGQGVSLWGREPLVARIERSPMMYGLYRRYLDEWRRRIGDTVMLLGSTAPLKHEGWGLREYSGQPLAEAPKLRAVFDELPPRPAILSLRPQATREYAAIRVHLINK